MLQLALCMVILARVPDSPPTGKTIEDVKERLCFYSFYLCSQLKSCDFIFFEINRVQLVHKAVTEICAVELQLSPESALNASFARSPACRIVGQTIATSTPET